jgi:parallel beta-helix repeat protein
MPLPPSFGLPVLRLSVEAALAAALVLAAPRAGAFPGTLNAWQQRYGAISPSGDSAGCQLCHANPGGGGAWNGYGWDIRDALDDPACDLDGDTAVSNAEAFTCVELLNSDGDGSGHDNWTEIGLGTQPGWTLGAFNTLYTRTGTIENQPAPTNIGPVDPDGTEPPPPPPPPPPSEEPPPGPLKKGRIVVKPGQSIQAAIDRAAPGATVYVLAGVYRELGDKTNALTINRDGIRLIGQSGPNKRVVLENAGNQRNGIVVVPEDRNDCMGCHADMAPPFPVHDGVEMGLEMREPMMYGVVVQGITIRGFRNNGLFTENVDGFRITDVESIDNKNYGIFPTLSKNGIIEKSRATGSDDSGIWVETSENVEVVDNVVEGNVNGFELSNSDDVLFARNVVRGNTVGMAILLLPDIFDDRAGAKRITIRKNRIYDNNKPNTATPGSILSYVPPGVGILHVGVDDSLIERNRIENNGFTGIGIVDYCLIVAFTPFNCSGGDPNVTDEFRADHPASNNRVERNVLVNNGTNPTGDFADFAGDISLLTFGDRGNCFRANVFDTFYSFFGILPECEE